MRLSSPPLPPSPRRQPPGVQRRPFWSFQAAKKNSQTDIVELCRCPPPSGQLHHPHAGATPPPPQPLHDPRDTAEGGKGESSTEPSDAKSNALSIRPSKLWCPAPSPPPAPPQQAQGEDTGLGAQSSTKAVLDRENSKMNVAEHCGSKPPPAPPRPRTPSNPLEFNDGRFGVFRPRKLQNERR